MRRVDPFDLPDWLGEEEVTWSADAGLRTGHAVPGRLSGSGHQPVPCDLLAVDVAYPRPVADQDVRHDAHQAWRHGQVLLVRPSDRLTLAVPGTRFTADLALDALARLAKAVGASPDRYSVLLRIGADGARLP
ncbi:hypothetical protein [Nocardioides sp.]|uniref:hypothetical protein n=1 Tax=Nocardioides sp. TaxID=35761 RepID=UPI003784A89E